MNEENSKRAIIFTWIAADGMQFGNCFGRFSFLLEHFTFDEFQLNQSHEKVSEQQIEMQIDLGDSHSISTLNEISPFLIRNAHIFQVIKLFKPLAKKFHSRSDRLLSSMRTLHFQIGISHCLIREQWMEEH